MGRENTAWRERENRPSNLKNITDWGDFAWTQVTTISSALEGMKTVECNMPMNIHGNDPQEIKSCFCLRGQRST